MYDPDYKLRHKPPPVSRLAHYKRLPPNMVGDPGGPWHCRNPWDQRCRAVYAHMIALKRGAVAPRERVGLWFWDGERYRQ